MKYQTNYYHQQITLTSSITRKRFLIDALSHNILQMSRLSKPKTIWYTVEFKKKVPLHLRIFSSHVCEAHERILLKLLSAIKDVLCIAVKAELFKKRRLIERETS